MKALTEELKQELHKSHAGGFGIRVKWDSIYDTEEELIRDMFHKKIYTDEDNVPYYKWCRGYEFISSFRNYYKKNGRLTDKQMTQLKRLASEIAFRIYC